MRMSPVAGVAATFFIAATWGAGCGSSSIDAINDPPPGPPGTNPDGGGGGGFEDASNGGEDASNPNRDGGGSGDFCKGTGAAIPIPGGDLCTGDLGRKLFKMAACSCTTTTFGGKLTTDSFNSTTEETKRSGGSIGANEKITDTGDYDIRGSAYAGGVNVAADADALTFTSASASTVRNDFWSGGNIRVTGSGTVGRDVHTTGNAVGIGSVKAVGDIYLEEGKSATGFGNRSIKKGDVTVPLPCDCTDKLDIAGIVPKFKTRNDNAAAGINENSLANGGTVTLPCGRYYLSSIGGPGATINVKGRVAIFVAGNLNVAGQFKIDLAEKTEIDLFVVGNFSMSGNTEFGSVKSPSRVRFYIGGTSFGLAGNSKIGGNFYAPNAVISAPQSGFEMWGAVFGKQLQFPGFFTIHYDEAVLDLEGCRPPGQTCNACGDCAHACKNGQCGACETSADCCAPLVCAGGKCISDIR